jgi:hypothetical protein
MSAGEFGMFAFDFDGEAPPGFSKVEIEDERILVDTLVFASITEMTADGSAHMGTAKWTVHNVTPGDGKVRLWIEQSFTGALPYRISVWAINTRI